MKRKIALILMTLMMIASVHSFAAVTGGREYAFADDNAQVTTNISADGDVATVSVYISGGIYGFTGISVGYKYDPQMLTLLKTDGTPAEENAVADDVLQKSIKKANLNYGWLESFSHKNGQIRYFITSNGEFASYRSGETEKVVELKFKINTAGGEDSISYLPEATTITCGDTSIYYNPARITEKMLDGSSIFKIGKNLKADYIEITDETYAKINTVYMAVGETKSLKIKSQMPSEILWGGAGDVATVDEKGVVTALAPGKATVTAFDFYGNSDSINIIVQESKLLPEEIKIICPDTLMAGDMIRPTYEMSPKNVTATSVIWSLEGENALLLTDDPVLWALSEGRVLLRASLAADVNIYTEKYIDIVPAPKSNEKVVTGSFLVPEKLYANPKGEATFDITPKLFNVAGAPIAKDVYSEFYDIEYKAPETKGITFENGILTVTEDAPAVTEMTISAVVGYKLDGKAIITLESNKFCVYNSKMTDVKIEGAKFEDGIYKVKADDYKIVPVADGQVYSVEIKNGDVIDVYFFSSDKKGVLGYNFNYMIKHISVQVVQ